MASRDLAVWWQSNVTQKVGQFAARPEVQRTLGALGAKVQTTRSADDLAAELETQARKLHGQQHIMELISQWLDWSEKGHGTYMVPDSDEVAGGELLTFKQALLRSHAFEGVLDGCSKTSSVRAALQASEQDVDTGALLNVLHTASDQLLLPGSEVFWRSLMEVLFKSTGADLSEKATASVSEARCDHWARRAVAVAKRRWRTDVLPDTLKRLDEESLRLATNQSPEEAKADAGSEFLRPASGQQMTKQAIQQALARDKMLQLSATARRLKERTQLLCSVCTRLEKTADDAASVVQEGDRLLQDADAMLSSLDSKVKDCMAEQEKLEAQLNEVSGGVQKQISQVQETLASLGERRSQLQDEKDQLLRRLEEVSMHLDQLSETQLACEREEGELKSKLKNITNSFEGNIAASLCRQKELADEKLRAVVCKECAHSLLDVLKSYSKQQKASLGTQLEKRRTELRHCCAAYLHQERLRVEAAGECFNSRTPRTSKAMAVQGSDDLSDLATQALTFAQESWQRAQSTLRLVEPLLGMSSTDVETLPSPSSLLPSRKESEEDCTAFFARVAASTGHNCVDCGLPEADWASVSHGTYLCMDCAGKHRGLGVHVSFVRSTTMDVWSDSQFQRMRLGGNAAFLRFLEGYPELRKPARSSADLAAKYGSRACAFYRKRLDAQCDAETSGGTRTAALVAPSAKEGHMGAEELAVPAAYTEVKRGGGSASTSAETSGGTMEEEKAALERAYLKHQYKLQQSVAPEAMREGEDAAATLKEPEASSCDEAETTSGSATDPETSAAASSTDVDAENSRVDHADPKENLAAQDAS